MSESQPGLHTSEVPGLDLIARGKVRDLYAVDDAHMLIVATDRISAFDVILPDPIPGKGEVLTALSDFWFQRVACDVPNHLSDLRVADVVADRALGAALAKRACVVRRLKPLPVEAIVRGYLIGSGWKDYHRHGAVSGVHLPAGLPMAARLPRTIFTPSSKAEPGAHDENITYQSMVELVGAATAAAVRDTSIRIYERAAAHARSRGIIIADTKFEFGLDAGGEVVLIDEVLTPDSSRFWPEADYRVGSSPPSFDKQYVRDYLETLAWDKTPPAPPLPPEVIARTAEKYVEARRRLTGPAPATRA